MSALKGKAAVVTGGSRGIGRAIVERLARDGAEVVFSYAGNAEAAAEVERTVRESGGTAHAHRADLTDSAAAERLMTAADEILGRLDVLVNNAAMEFPLKPIAETETETFLRVMTSSATAVFLTLRHAARRMRDNGRIVNLSTLNTVRPVPGNAPYVAGKGAIEQLTLVAARELGPRGITVNCVSPGATDTDLLHAANPGADFTALIAYTPLGRLGLPADIADVVAFLASPDARWITGQNIRATGGLG
jgi:3-oxoacyl-[acyl-carrier protein] reductase